MVKSTLLACKTRLF